MLKNENIEKYAVEIQKLLKEAKASGVNIQPYEKKIENSELVIECGITVYTDVDVECIYIPTYKLTE